MEVAAKLKGARMSAQKARLVADQIRGKSVESALEILQFSGRKGADIIKKVLESAIANAEHNDGADVDELKVSTIFVDEGMTEQCDMCSAVGIVFQALNLGRDTIFVALKINNAVMLLVATTNVTHGNATSTITTTSSFLRR